MFIAFQTVVYLQTAQIQREACFHGANLRQINVIIYFAHMENVLFISALIGWGTRGSFT